MRFVFSKKDKNNKQKSNQVKKESKIKSRLSVAKQKVLTLYEEGKTKVERSIKLEIITVVAITFVMATVLGFCVAQVTRSAGIGRHYYNSYTEQRKGLQERLTYFVQEINELGSKGAEVSIDIAYIKQVVEKNDSKQGAYLLLEYLESEVSKLGNTYLSDYVYREFESYKESLENSKAHLVYKDLKQLVNTGEWSEERAKTKLRSLFDPKKIVDQSGEQMIKQLTQELESRLEGYTTQSQTYLVNSEGEALYQDGFIKKIDIAQAIQRAGESDDEDRLTSIYPILVKGEIGYLINESSLKGALVEYYTDTPIILGWLCGMVAFVLLIFRFTRAKIRYIEYISYCL
ncbi:MAG: hypothetical protein ACRCW2_09010, partial [Cellulosilyticaceae bacterium]